MHVVEVAVYPVQPNVATLTDFVERVSAEIGSRPLSDHLWLDLQRGGSDGFISVSIADADGIVAAAQISAANHESALEVVAAPHAFGANSVSAVALARDAAETAIGNFRHAGGGALTLWVDDDEVGAALADVALEHGMTLHRTLHEMRVTLPIDQHSTVPTRPFAPGVDDDAWVRVNNRAFADHGEQGGWTRETLALRQQEPWFDPDGFRMHDIDGQLAAFCWTKIHEPTGSGGHQGDDRVGEIYVIAVDPEFHGRGLGKQLTLAGLDSISSKGITSGNLYVDGDNAAAVPLYLSLGYTIHRTRRAYGGHITTTRQEQP